MFLRSFLLCFNSINQRNPNPKVMEIVVTNYNIVDHDRSQWINETVNIGKN
jgi:hypothetical protein